MAAGVEPGALSEHKAARHRIVVVATPGFLRFGRGNVRECALSEHLRVRSGAQGLGRCPGLARRVSRTDGRGLRRRSALHDAQPEACALVVRLTAEAVPPDDPYTLPTHTDMLVLRQ